MRASCASTPRSTIIRLPSGARPAQSAAPEGGRSAVGHPPCRVGNSGRVRRVAPPRLRGVLGLATVRRAGAFRRLHPRILAPCFVAGIPASSPDAGFAAHPPPRVRPSHSAQRSPVPPAPHQSSFLCFARFSHHFIQCEQNKWWAASRHNLLLRGGRDSAPYQPHSARW